MSKQPAARLEEIAPRIERLVASPGSIRAPMVRLMRPVLARIGWQPSITIADTLALFEQLRKWGRASLFTQEEADRLLRAAIDELEANVKSVERATVVNREPSVRHAAWLGRMHRSLERAAHIIEASVEGVDAPGERAKMRVAAGTESSVLPPLQITATPEKDREAGEGEAEAPATTSRLLELQLGAIDHLLDAAREETDVIARRRRLLEAARQLLLETSAALPLDREGVDGRYRAIAREITALDRLEAAGVSADVGLLHQARTAVTRGERQRLFAVLTTIDRFAVSLGDAEVAARTQEAFAKLDPRRQALADEAIADSVERSKRDVFGDDVLDAVRDGYARARVEASSVKDHFVHGLLSKYLTPQAESSTLAACLAVDGAFDLGGVMSPVRVHEQELRLEAVRFPTPSRVVLVPAESPEDIPNAVIEDPRMVLLNLAEGKLLTRRFVQERAVTKPRTVMRGEARIYVLDGSGSMIGPRARMRDAILVAELSTLARRLSEPGRKTRVVLFYRYFTQMVGPTTRVDTSAAALEEIRNVLATPRSGGTNIEDALLASLRQVQEAQAEDPDLARAQIVLVTDGDAHVREPLIRAAREEAGALPVGISVIALGEENKALRKIVARQRARGERAFYHFISDETLKAISEGQIDDAFAIHAPQPAGTRTRTPTPAQEAAELESLVGTLVDELSALDRDRDVAAMERLHEERARESTFAAPAAGAPRASVEGERARLESASRDRRALEQRFKHWFPLPPADAAPGPKPSAGERADLDSVIVLIATICEVIRLVEGTELARQADAIDLLERLLADARLTPARYEAILAKRPAELRDALETLHRCVKWGLVEPIRPKSARG